MQEKSNLSMQDFNISKVIPTKNVKFHHKSLNFDHNNEVCSEVEENFVRNYLKD